jgi:hypothetical protein
MHTHNIASPPKNKPDLYRLCGLCDDGRVPPREDDAGGASIFPKNDSYVLPQWLDLVVNALPILPNGRPDWDAIEWDAWTEEQRIHLEMERLRDDIAHAKPMRFRQPDGSIAEVPSYLTRSEPIDSGSGEAPRPNGHADANTSASGAARDIAITVTLGNRKSYTVWRDTWSGTFDAFARGFEKSPIGQKDGPCFVPATLRGTARKKTETVEIGLVALDADCGHTFEEIFDMVSTAGYEAVIHSTHSHETTETEISGKDFDAKGIDGVAAYMMQEKGYLPDIVSDAEIVRKVEVGVNSKTGEVTENYIVRHAPCPKFRIMIPLASPWQAADYPSQTKANAAWKAFVTALAASLGLHHDQSCVRHLAPVLSAADAARRANVCL